MTFNERIARNRLKLVKKKSDRDWNVSTVVPIVRRVALGAFLAALFYSFAASVAAGIAALILVFVAPFGVDIYYHGCRPTVQKARNRMTPYRFGASLLLVATGVISVFAAELIMRSDSAISAPVYRVVKDTESLIRRLALGVYFEPSDSGGQELADGGKPKFEPTPYVPIETSGYHGSPENIQVSDSSRDKLRSARNGIAFVPKPRSKPDRADLVGGSGITDRQRNEEALASESNGPVDIIPEGFAKAAEPIEVIPADDPVRQKKQNF